MTRLSKNVVTEAAPDLCRDRRQSTQKCRQRTPKAREVGAEAKFESAEITTSYCMGLLHDFIKTFVQRAAGDRPKAVPVFLRVSRSRMRLDCFRGLPFFDNREMIRAHRVL